MNVVNVGEVIDIKFNGWIWCGQIFCFCCYGCFICIVGIGKCIGCNG